MPLHPSHASPEETVCSSLVVSATVDARGGGRDASRRAYNARPVPDRRLAWNACYNARDVGGYTTIDGRAVRWGALVRADNVCRLTEDGRAALSAYGVRTVVDLRRGTELAAVAHPYAGGTDPAYVNVDVDEAMPELLALQPTEYYGRVLDARAASLAAAVGAFADAPTGGVLFHCQSGKDRTGIVVALLLALAGVPRETIVADYVLTDECLAAYRDDVLRAATGDRALLTADLERWRARPEKIERMLDRLDALGGAEAYLRGAGLASGVLERARARLL